MYKSVTTGFAALALLASAAAFAHPGASTHHNWRAHRAAHMQKRLAHFKSKLQITSAEEGAWDGYVSALKAMHTPPKHKAKKASGVTPAPQLFNAMAQRASTRADKAQSLASSVNTLYQQLNAKQQATFNKHFADMRAKMHRHRRRWAHKMHKRHMMKHPAAAATR
jgi:hypothetical protein